MSLVHNGKRLFVILSTPTLMSHFHDIAGYEKRILSTRQRSHKPRMRRILVIADAGFIHIIGKLSGTSIVRGCKQVRRS